MRIALIQPRVYSPLLDYRYRGENLGLCSIAAVLREHGYPVWLINDALACRDLDETVQDVLTIQPDLIGVAVSAQSVTGEALEYIEAVKAALPQSYVCVGGIFPSLMPEKFLTTAKGLDGVIRGEGEHAMLELAEALEAGTPLQEIAGLAFRSEQQIITNRARPLISDLRALPTPARDTLGYLLAENRRVGLYSARGCYGNCTFCSLNAFWGNNHVRLRSPEQAVDEVVSLASQGARKLRFINDIFVDCSQQGREWLTEFHRRLKPYDLDLNLWMQFRAQDVTLDALLAMKELGLSKLLVGVESGSQATLDVLNKRTSIAENHRALACAVEAGIKQFAIGFLMFHPFVTLNEIRENLGFLRRMPAFRYKNLLSRVYPYHGTRFEKQTIAEGLYIPGDSWYEVGSYRFRSPDVQRLYNAIKEMKICYGKMIWFEAALDVEERFIKGALPASPVEDRLTSKIATFRDTIHKFKHGLSTTLFQEFCRILTRTEIGDRTPTPQSQALYDASGLEQLRTACENQMLALQRDLGLAIGFSLGIEALPDLID